MTAARRLDFAEYRRSLVAAARALNRSRFPGGSVTCPTAARRARPNHGRPCTHDSTKSKHTRIFTLRDVPQPARPPSRLYDARIRIHPGYTTVSADRTVLYRASLPSCLRGYFLEIGAEPSEASAPKFSGRCMFTTFAVAAFFFCPLEGPNGHEDLGNFMLVGHDLYSRPFTECMFPGAWLLLFFFLCEW